MGKRDAAWTLGEKFMAFNMMVGGITMLVTVIPAVPWRYAQLSGAMGVRFSMDRRYSLLHVGNQFGQGMSWFRLRKDTCFKMIEFNKQNPMQGILGAVSGQLGTGGALVGCQGWQNCKDHVSIRCNTYTFIAIVGAVCVVLQLVSMSCAFATPIMLNSEKSLKKTKKIESAKMTTMIVSIVGFVPGFLSVSTWTVITDSSFKELASRAAYPYPSAFVGCYAAGFGAFLMFVGCMQCVNRVFHCCSPKGDPEEEEEQTEQYAAADATGAAPFIDGAGAPPAVSGPPGY